MNPEEFKKTVKAHNKKIKKEIEAMQSGITEGKNNNKKLLKLTK